jgi:hypothetical protein
MTAIKLHAASNNPRGRHAFPYRKRNINGVPFVDRPANSHDANAQDKETSLSAATFLTTTPTALFACKRSGRDGGQDASPQT